MKRPLCDIEFPERLRAVVVPFLEGIVEEVKRDHAARHEYVAWAEPVLARLRSTEGDFAPLDEMDVETFRRDVLPSLIKEQTKHLSGMVAIQLRQG